MCDIDKIIEEINAEIIRLKIKRDYLYYARNFNRKASTIIKQNKHRETTARLNPKWEQIKLSTKK